MGSGRGWVAALAAAALGLLASGCATTGPVAVHREFVAVTASSGDTLEGLAGRYLGDPRKAWMIAEFNDIEALTAGQEVAVPLVPFKAAGLVGKRYQTVPVLSYHRFTDGGKTDKMTVDKAAFEAQMRLLKEKGFRVVSLDELFDFLAYKRELPARSVAITIDDGWRSTYDIAWPILKRYGYPATLFVYEKLIKGSATTLSWDLVAKMSSEGLDIQPHTLTHRSLSTPTAGESQEEYLAALQKELGETGRIIREKTGREPKYLAYPYGDTNHLVITLARKLGLRGALTVTRGGNPFFVHDFRVGRSMIYGDHDIAQFQRNLEISDSGAVR
jgi:peptidoglycan/xylan/chitin deacetylase (PgdA/CDA1 family)